MLVNLSELFAQKRIHLMTFPADDEVIRKEYYYIKSQMFKGDGESASMAVARFRTNILASSNLKDIAGYCKMHKVDYVTTMDFLCFALQHGKFTLERCNKFITTVLKSNSKLPVDAMNAHQCRELNFL